MRRIIYVVIFLYVTVLIAPGVCWASRSGSVESFVNGLFFPAILLTAIFSIFARRLWISLLLLAPFVVLAPAEIGYIVTYGHPSDSNIWATIVESNPSEMHDFLGPHLYIGLLAIVSAVAIAVSAIVLAYRENLKWSGRVYCYAALISILFPAAILLATAIRTAGLFTIPIIPGFSEIGSYTEELTSGYPFGIPFRVYSSIEDAKSMRASAERLRNFRFGARLATATLKHQIIVLIIGESSQRNHWQLFGYSRPTNPELSQITHVVTLPNLITVWPASRMSIQVMLSRKPATDIKPYFDEASILRVFSEAGFRTAWFSNQMAVSALDSPISMYAYEADEVHFFNTASWRERGTYDEVMFPSFKRFISQHPDENLFIVLHTLGSHNNYAYRFPPEFDSFHSTEFPGYGPNDMKQLNTYDNSVLYTDHILAEATRILQATDSVSAMLYSSDHGEDLPNTTCRLSGHGNAALNDFIIPGLFWFSDAYVEAFPARVNQLIENRSRPVTTEIIFETLVDMGGLEFPSHNMSRSLFSSTLVDHPRIVTPFWQVDFDHAGVGKDCQILYVPKQSH